jgi:thymidylate kinase
MKPGARLIAIEGVSGPAVMAAARKLRARGRKRAGISEWDASGIFGDLGECDDEGAPSARVLLLLYATDLAFRLRWEIQPALSEGRVVIAAPYVETAVAFGRAAGLRGGWLNHLFGFAPPAAESVRIARPRRAARGPGGFMEFGCERMARARAGLSERRLLKRAAAFLKKTLP